MKTYLVITFAFFSQLLFSQELKKDIFYLRAGFYELSLGYERIIGEKISVGLEADCRAAFDNGTYHKIPYSSMNTAFSGFRVKPVVCFFPRETRYKFTIAPSYRFLKANHLIHDPGKFSGATTSTYSEYSQSNHEFGMNVLWHKSFYWHRAFSWYGGFGIAYKRLERQYIIEGFYSSQQPSNKHEVIYNVFPAIHFGIKIQFAKEDQIIPSRD
jgi:hypothetical protein